MAGWTSVTGVRRFIRPRSGQIAEGRNLVTEGLDATAPRKGAAGGSLSTMRLAELQALAAEMGLKGTTRMRKSDLVAAIREARGGAPARQSGETPAGEA